jgi:hypothetical protein
VTSKKKERRRKEKKKQTTKPLFLLFFSFPLFNQKKNRKEMARAHSTVSHFSASRAVLCLALFLGMACGQLTLIQTTEQLSQARNNLAGCSTQFLAFFAGGHINLSNTGTTNVDIFDLETRNWTRTDLSAPRGKLVCTAVQDVVLFAGGIDGSTFSAVVDVFNITSRTWLPPLTLQEARYSLAGVTVGTNKAIFAGGNSVDGATNTIDIFDYDTMTITPSTNSLSVSRFEVTATAVGDMAFFAGGFDDTPFDTVKKILFLSFAFLNFFFIIIFLV